MRQEIIDELIDILDYNLKENKIELEMIKEILPIKSFSKIKKEVESLGFSINDFQYTGFNAMPFRFVKGVTIIDFLELSTNYLEFMELEERVLAQREHCNEYLLNDDFESFIGFLDKRIKLEAYKVFYEFIPSNERYNIFRNIYARMEYGFNDDRDFIESYFKDRFESEEWIDAISVLKKQVGDKKLITIFRGEGKKSTPYTDAFSWTLQKKTATYFADRFNDRGKIYKAQVLITDVIDYIDQRSEFEVLVEAKQLKNITRVR